MLTVDVRIQTRDELGNMMSEYVIPVSLELLQEPTLLGKYIAHTLEELRKKTDAREATR